MASNSLFFFSLLVLLPTNFVPCYGILHPTSTTPAIVQATGTVCGLNADNHTHRIVCTNFSRSAESMPASFVISGTSSYDAISGGPSFLCSLRSGDTSFFCWDGIRKRMKRIYHGPAALSEISVGSWHIAAIDGDRRSIRCWIYGCNRHASRCQHFLESASGEYRSLTSGNDFTCAINGTHDVHCWGPHGNSIKRRFSGMYMHSLSAGGGSMCGLNKTGHIICTKNQPNVPSGESFEFTSLAVGSNQTCAITRKNGAVVCWGWDGGLYFPMGSTRFEFLVSGGNLICGLTSDAFNVSCWGSNERNYSSASAVIQSLPNVLPGVCVSHQVSCPCGICPNSWDLCGGGSGVICKKSDTSTMESCQQFSSQVTQHPLEIAPSHSNRKRGRRGKGKKHDWVTALSRVGLVTSLALIFLPAIKTFYPFIRKREVDAKFSAYPYAMTLCNCLIYVLYAIAKSNTLILIINAIGVLVEFAYALVVMRYGTLRQSVTIAVLYLGAALASIGLFMWLILTQPVNGEDARVLGWFCVGSGIAMYVSNFPAMVDACKRGTTKDVPLYLTVIGIINTIVWLIVGILTPDLYIEVQNMAGLFTCAVQAIAYCWITYCCTPAPAHQRARQRD